MEHNIFKASIKKDFFLIIICCSFVPFSISLLPLWFILHNSHIQIAQVDKKQQHTEDLEILDALHKAKEKLYITMQSIPFKEYLAANIDSEPYYRSKLSNYLTNINKEIEFKNITWLILSKRANIIYALPQVKENLSASSLVGAYLNKDTKEIVLSLPIYSYTSSLIYAYIAIKIPFSSLQYIHPYLSDIINISSDLSALTFKTVFNLPNKKNYLSSVIYFYIFIFILFNLVAVYLGIRILQTKIIVKLKLLTSRILNDLNTSTKIIIDNPMHNEIDSLSFIFNNYLKYIKYLQVEIERSSKLSAIGHISHAIAHDLRKPFSNIKIFIQQIENLQSLYEINTLIAEYKPILQNSIIYVEHLLKDIMEAGISKLNITEVKLCEIIEKCMQNCLKINKNNKINIDYQIDIPCLLKVDELRIVRTFSNIISNAIEAIGEHGKIWIHAKLLADNKLVEIIIGNDNSYINPEDIEHLFEPFYTKNKINGTGLGLSIAQKIVQLHGGQLSCRSNNNLNSQIVEFILTLPCGNKIARIEKSIKKIFIIDDDPFIGRSWQRLVTDAQVLSFLSPINFLNDVRQDLIVFDENTLIISDFYFNPEIKINFYEFILELRRFYKSNIFLSTDVADENLMLDFLQKNKVIKIAKHPCSFAELMELNF